MPAFADFALYDREGRLVAVAEVRNKFGTSPEWAARLRRNLLAHGGASSADYFVLITPDRLYLWKDAGSDVAPVTPDHEIDARPIFGPYFERSGLRPDEVSGHAFELVAAAWLADLMRTGAGEFADEADALHASGFVAAVRGGRVAYEVAA